MAGNHCLTFSTLAQNPSNRVGQRRVIQRWEVVEHQLGEIHEIALRLDR
jgi:hypothetical protein